MFKESNAVFNSSVKSKAKPVHVLKHRGDNFSCWELSGEEINDIMISGKVWMHTGKSPDGTDFIMLYANKPFKTIELSGE